MSPNALHYVEIERRPHGYAVVERTTREVLDVAPDESVAGVRARAWDRIFLRDGDPPPPALVTFAGKPLAEAPASRARSEGKPRRVREFRHALRDPRDRVGRWMPMIFDSPGMCPAGATVHLEQMPQLAWRGEFLRVDRACAPHFRIAALIVGTNYQQASMGVECPATIFAQTRRWFRWTLDVAHPGSFVTIRVRNVSAEPRAFHAVILGREITRIEPASPQIPFRGDHLVVDRSSHGGPRGYASPYGRQYVDTARGFRLAGDFDDDDGKGSRR